MRKRLYLVRHGATEYNDLGVYFGKTDCPLNGEGILQGKALGYSLAGIHFDEIYTSPMKRCLDTARFITTEKNPVVLNALKELDFGVWEGLNYKQCMELYPKVFTEWSSNLKNTAPPEGEHYLDFYERIREFCFNKLSGKAESILIVAHKGVLQMLASILLAGDDSLFWNINFQLGKYSIIDKEKDHGTLNRLNV